MICYNNVCENVFLRKNALENCVYNKGLVMKKSKLFINVFLTVLFLCFSHSSYAQSWANIGTTGTLNNNELCYTDGTDIICDAGITVNDSSATLIVPGTVSATAFVGNGASLTNINASAITVGVDDLTDGYYVGGNMAVGSVFDNLTTGVNNVAYGPSSLDSNIDGGDNTAIGHRILADNTSGTHNTALGSANLFQNTTGSFNVAVGSSVLYQSNASNNTGVGFLALRYNTSGKSNTAMGHSASRQNQSGFNNTSVGFRSLYANNGGNYNVAFGSKAGDNLTNGSNNISIGASTTLPNSTGSDQLNIGNTLYGDLANDRIGVGVGTPLAELDVSGTVSATAFVGDGASLTNIDASAITIGIDDLTDGSAAGYSVFLGDGAGNDDGGPNPNTGIGYRTQRLTTGYANTSLGARSLDELGNGDDNTAIGYMALRYGQGNSNVALGSRAGHGVSGNASTIFRNVLIGASSGFNLLTGADDNTFLGTNSGSNVTTGANNIMIGATTKASAPTASNELNIGNAIYGADISQSAIAKIGINVPVPTESLEVSGTVSATAFVGDGSGLTGVGGLWTDAGDYINRGGVRVYDGDNPINFTGGSSIIAFDTTNSSILVGDPFVSGGFQSSNIGQRSLVLGYRNRSEGGNSIVAGYGDTLNQTNQANNSLIVGRNNRILTDLRSSDNSLAIGDGNVVNSVYSGGWAIGSGNRVTGGWATGTAIGQSNVVNTGTSAMPGHAIALGYSNTITARHGVVLGMFNTVSLNRNGGDSAFAFGNSLNVTAKNSTAIGVGASVSGDDSMIIGVGADASGTEVTDTNTLAIMGASGGVGIGITSPNVELDVSGSIEYTGTLSDVSDRRLKQNIQSLDDGALAKIDQIDTVSFEMKDNPSVTEFGVIAQDFEKVYPELVNTADDDMGTKSVNYMGLIAPMIKAMQEQQQQIKALQQELKELKEAN